jgi:hypothetical protein
MSSGRYTTIKLDPFYQQFLRVQFNQNNPVFKFPAKKHHDLKIRFEFYLTPPPEDYKPANYRDWNFHIEIPYSENSIKHPDFYNYISENKNKLYANRIRNYYYDVIHEEFTRLRNKGFKKEECIICVMEDYNFEPKYEERVIKEYQRYLKRERDRRFRIRVKRIKKTKKTYIS